MESQAVEDYLKNGWEIAGYSVTMMAAGALVHNILLRKDAALTAVSVITNVNGELGRSVTKLAPKPADTKKKGFFG